LTDHSYDIIIAGGGLSGLSLAYYLNKGGYIGRILILDTHFEPINDKTWCFWTKDEPPFPEIIHKQWDFIRTEALSHDKIHELAPYTYYCIRSGDFKKMAFESLKSNQKVTFHEARISSLKGGAKKAKVITEKDETFEADYIFQSALPPKELAQADAIKYPLIQHFMGWEIKVKHDFFDDSQATFMDFDASWTPGVGFMYLLPWNKREALLEYTIFSGELEKNEVYEDKIRNYIHHKLGLTEADYEIERVEKGRIPMEDRPYLPWYEERIMNMGTSAGLSKPSTGYTFLRIQHHVKKLAQSLIEGRDPILPTKSKPRFVYYDLLLLHVLYTTSNTGIKIFRDLFERNRIQRVFKFLDEETNLAEEIRTMASVPYWPFIKALFANLLR
jgi:lycopene beta-cyclase